MNRMNPAFLYHCSVLMCRLYILDGFFGEGFHDIFKFILVPVEQGHPEAGYGGKERRQRHNADPCGA